MTTLHKDIENYLETRNNRDEKSVLNQFKEYMQKKSPEVQTKDATLNDFQSFPKSLSISATSKKSYASRLKPFQESIGLSEVKVKKNRTPKNDSSELEKEQKAHAKIEKKLSETEEESAARWKTIEEKDAIIKVYTAEKEQQCSRCSEIATLNKTITSNKAAFDKKMAKYDEVQYFIDSGQYEEAKQLVGQRTQIKEEIAKGTEMRKNERFVKVLCPMKGNIVSFGNDCSHCNDSPSCGKYAELTNPRA